MNHVLNKFHSMYVNVLDSFNAAKDFPRVSATAEQTRAAFVAVRDSTEGGRQAAIETLLSCLPAGVDVVRMGGVCHTIRSNRGQWMIRGIQAPVIDLG